MAPLADPPLDPGFGVSPVILDLAAALAALSLRLASKSSLSCLLASQASMVAFLVDFRGDGLSEAILTA